MKSLVVLLAALLPALALADEVVPSISVTGFAEAKLAPNQATVSLNVLTENPKLDAAKKEHDKKIKTLMDIVDKLDIKNDDVKTAYANVQPVYDYLPNTNRPKFRTYQLSNQIDIKVSDMATPGPLMDKLTEAGFDRINGITFGLKDEREQREAMLNKAIVNARDKAQKMATAAGAKIGKPITISESGAYNAPQPMLFAKAMRAEAATAADGSMPSYSPTGVIDISQSVNVTFRLE